jgi:hypothetical protein
MEHIMNVKKSALVLSLIASVASMSAFAQGVSRAEVVSDLQAYQQSGLSALSSTEQGVDTNSAQYQAALASYLQLRGQSGEATTAKLTRAQVKADLVAWQQAGLPDVAIGDRTPDLNSNTYRAELAAYQRNPDAITQASNTKASKTALSREAVQADLQAWHAAGMPALSNGDHGVDTNSAEYKAAYARYEQLRGHNS